MDSKQGLRLVINNIKKIRINNGFSKKQLAAKVKLNYPNYCKLENHKLKSPKLNTILRAAEALDVKWEEIFKGCH